MKKEAILIANKYKVQTNYSGINSTLYLSGEKAEEALMEIVNHFNGLPPFVIKIND